MKTDIQISQENKMEEIEKIAKKLKLKKEVFEPYGRYMAKLDTEKIKDRKKKKNLILVTAISTSSFSCSTSFSVRAAVAVERFWKAVRLRLLGV